MDNIISAINLLDAVRSTMDTISVVGIDNQDKFVGCANAIQTVSQTLGKFVQESKDEEEHKKKLQEQEEQLEREASNGR